MRDTPCSPEAVSRACLEFATKLLALFVDATDCPVKGVNVPGVSATTSAAGIDALIDDWRLEHRTARSRLYIEANVRLFRELATHAGISEWSELTRSHVVAWRDHVAENGRLTQPGRPAVKPCGKSLNNLLSAVRAFLRWAVRAEHLRENVAASVNWSRQTHQTRRAFTAGEVSGLIAAAAARGSPLRSLLYRVLALTGWRIGSVEALRWRHVELTDEGLRAAVPGKSAKSGRSLVVALDAESLRLLRARHQETGETAEDFVFGKRPHRNVLLADCRRAGIAKKDVLGRGAGFHCFRRFVGTELSRLKVSPKVIQSRLDHKDVRTTLRSYVDEANLDDFDAATALAASICAAEKKNVARFLASGAARDDTSHATTPMTSHPVKPEQSARGVCLTGVVADSEGERLGPSARTCFPSPPFGGTVFQTRASGVEPDARPGSDSRASGDVPSEMGRLLNRVLDLIERSCPGRSAGTEVPDERFRP